MSAYTLSKIVGYITQLALVMLVGAYVPTTILIVVAAMTVILAVANYIEGRTKP